MYGHELTNRRPLIYIFQTHLRQPSRDEVSWLWVSSSEVSWLMSARRRGVSWAMHSFWLIESVRAWCAYSSSAVLPCAPSSNDGRISDIVKCRIECVKQISHMWVLESDIWFSGSDIYTQLFWSYAKCENVIDRACPGKLSSATTKHKKKETGSTAYNERL